MRTYATDDDRVLKKRTYSIDNHRLNEAQYHPSPHCCPMPTGNSPILIVVHSISLPEGDYATDYVRQLFLGRLDCNIHPSFATLRGAKVSAHLFIRRNAEILQFVPFNLSAWHAGKSSYAGRSDCNDFSIGIELEGAQREGYTQSQYECLAGICDSLIAYYPGISKKNLVGHKDIAPGRKDDPWNMDWDKLKGLMQAKD